MKRLHSEGKVFVVLILIILCIAVLISALYFARLRNRHRPLSLNGAVIQQNEDTRRQSPIADVEVTIANNEAVSTVKSNATGYFSVELRPTVKAGRPITLQFRHPGYQPIDLKSTVGDTIYVVRMVPLHPENEVPAANQPSVAVDHIVIRYSIETSGEINVGTRVITFQVPNTGGVPCDPHGPCSPDGRWKASIGSASMDAGQGNVFRNARVFCIAGPCPFTKVDSDDFSRGGRNIAVSERNWSDTTMFLFQAEVFRQQVSDIIRESYPVIYGRTFNFSLPSAAEGPSLEAELDRNLITFPLGPDPKLSWAACNVVVGSRYSKSYRCELKPGFKFP